MESAPEFTLGMALGLMLGLLFLGWVLGLFSRRK
jgi:hypothetical protein